MKFGNTILHKTASLNDKIVQALSDDLRRPPYKGNPNPLAGHCYVASEALYHLFPGVYKPCVVRIGGGTHWYLTNLETGAIVDLTAGQFDGPVPYEQGRGCGFLTRGPSKRAQIVLERIKQ